MSAILTNAITNALHALFLFIYASAALIHWLKKNKYFTGLIVTFFICIFLLKVLGVIVHYAHGASYISSLWIAISLGVVFLNYITVQAIAMPSSIRSILLLITLIATWFFILTEQFICIAIPSMLVYLLAAYFTQKIARLGFLLVAASNLVWILARQVANTHLGYELPVAWRYDNDIYHLLLIISTFVIYKSVGKGDWLKH